MKITNALSAPDKPNPHGVSAKPIYESPHAAAVHITLQPGQALRRHTTPVVVFFYVLEGTGFVEIGEEREQVTRDMIIESPARVPHRLSNEGDQVFRVLVVKVPNPTESTRLRVPHGARRAAPGDVSVRCFRGSGSPQARALVVYAEACFRARWRRPRASAARIACATISAVTGNGSL